MTMKDDMKIDKTVHVVGGFHEYEKMFVAHGWTLVDNVDDADLVQFCGGEDVYPLLYDSACNTRSHYNRGRDDYEERVYDLAVERKKAIAGICRGAQFVHVMNFGALWQHCDKHTLSGFHRAHIVTNLKCLDGLGFDQGFFVTSTHHQQMKGDEGEVILAAWESEHKEDGKGPVVDPAAFAWDVEAVWHEATRSFCYQPHPEHVMSNHACQRFYFQAIARLCFGNNFERMTVEKKEAS